ncbi:DMT family transporter [Pseudanabaena sp. lw0831]|uniref:DMT family transporter n=1 Tax=Pseudanabaena sp. lw0831 TaxID=1357935 RepID=UPI001916C35A|nr:DMT family transporter [Pseudanabaena sp. lw0831]
MSMQSLLFWLIAFVMGVITSVYLPMNGVVARYVGSALLANIPFYLLGAITTLLLYSLTGNFSAVSRFREVPSYLYLSGFISAFLVFGSTFLIPRLGAGRFFVLFVAGQILMALAVSHFGLLDSPQDPITLKKVFGAILLLIGVVLATQ